MPSTPPAWRFFVRRIALIGLAAASLAACVTTESETPTAAAAPVASAAAAPAPAPAPAPAQATAPAGRRQNFVTARTQRPAPEPAPSDPTEVMTIEVARGQCWMQLEGNKSAPRDLEARAKVVETCAQTKMQNAR